MRYLQKSDFILINKRTIDAHGGAFVAPHNLLNEAPLDYLIEAVNAELFGQPLYPTLSDKAGLYLYNVISNHMFQDGNKRTGLGSALVFLRMNGYKLQPQLVSIELDNQSIPNAGESTNEILFEFIMQVASGSLSLEACQQWLNENIIPI